MIQGKVPVGLFDALTSRDKDELKYISHNEAMNMIFNPASPESKNGDFSDLKQKETSEKKT